MSDATPTIGHASWCDFVTFDTFLRNKVRATVNQDDSKLTILYYCANPILEGLECSVKYTVDVEDNILVNLDFLVELMQNATASLYQSDSDRYGVITAPEVPMYYTDCYKHVPPLEYKAIP